MIKLFLLLAFLLTSIHPIDAAEEAVPGPTGVDAEFIKQLNSIKSPFDDGMPKVVVAPPPVVYHPPPKKIRKHRKKPKPPEVVVLPNLNLEGVMVGGDMHEAIINDQDVSLLGYIEGVQLISVSKEGVGLLFKGKKFFLKVD